MGSKNPATGLFPDRNNISYPNGRHNSNDENSSYSLQESDKDTTCESVSTSVVNSIIKQEGWHNVEQFHDDIRNERFYLAGRYKRRNNIALSDMVNNSDDISSNDIDFVDFSTYNRKVKQEYALREKVETLLRSRDPGGIQVYNEEVLNNTYSISQDKTKKLPKSLRGNLRYEFSKRKKGRPYPDDRESINSMNDDVSAVSTCIIDQTSYRNLMIDESNPFVTRNRTGDSSLLESSKEYSPHKNLSGWRGVVNRYFSIDNEYHIQRKMTLRHIQMLSVGTCLSVGFFLTSGRAFSIAGPFGTLLGFTLTGSVILATLLSFTELSALIPVSSGFSGLASRFVEDAFGFGIGWTYVFSCIISFPAEAASSTFYLTYFSKLKIGNGTIAGFVTLFIIYPIICNLLSVNILGECIFFFGTIKIIISIVMMFVMVIINAGHNNQHEQVGFRFWTSSKSVGSMTYGLFRPTFDLKDVGDGSTNGIGGSTGRFLALLSVMLISTFAYSGVEMTFLASGEVKNPRKTIPSSIKRTFSSILFIYILSILTVGINIYSGDPRLLPYYSPITNERTVAADEGIGTQWQLENTCNIRTRMPGSTVDYSSPWVLALQSYGFCTFAAAFDVILIIFTSSASISSLFNSSRALYSMSIQRKAPHIFQVCSKNGVPYISVIVSGLFSTIAYLAVNKGAQDNFNILVNMSSASTSIIWFGLNASFLRFFYALKTRKDYISREDKSYPFRSPFQPYLAFYGLIGCFIFVMFMGYTNFLTGYWDTRSFFSAYGGLIIFCVCYVGFKIVRTSKIQRLDQLDMDTGRREMDRMIWTEHQFNTNNNILSRLTTFWS